MYQSSDSADIDSGKIIGAYLKDGKKVYTESSSLWFDIGIISKFGKEKADELKAENKKTYQEIMYKILDLEYKKQEPTLVLNDNKTELISLISKFEEGWLPEDNLKF